MKILVVWLCFKIHIVCLFYEKTSRLFVMKRVSSLFFTKVPVASPEYESTCNLSIL
jgi:hypothetical protein